MAKHVIDDAVVRISSVDISDYIESVEIVAGQPHVTVTCMGDGWVQRLPAKIKNWSARLNFFHDYSSTAEITDVLKDVFTTTTGAGTDVGTLHLFVKPTTAGVSATNPAWTGTVLADGDFAQIAAAVGEANKGSVTLQGVGTLTFQTSATA